jgi:hypothetical protein
LLLSWRRTHISWNSVDEILDCSLDVVKCGSKGKFALITRESHRHELVNFGFIVTSLLLRRFGGFLLGLFCLGLVLLCLLLLLGWLGLDLLLGLGLGLLNKRVSTWTWVMTTMKSVSLMPSF